MKIRRSTNQFLKLAFVCLTLGLCTIASANEATSEEAAWFSSEWTVVPAPIEGYETIITQDPKRARIEHLEDARIQRTMTIRNTESIMQFDVRSFGGNFPWWSTNNGANYVAKKVDDDRFILAPVSMMGKAEWDKGWLYQRVTEAHAADEH